MFIAKVDPSESKAATIGKAREFMLLPSGQLSVGVATIGAKQMGCVYFHAGGSRVGCGRLWEVCVLRVAHVKKLRALACVFGKWYEGFCEATPRCTAVAALRSNSKRELLLKSCGATINPN